MSAVSPNMPIYVDTKHNNAHSFPWTLLFLREKSFFYSSLSDTPILLHQLLMGKNTFSLNFSFVFPISGLCTFLSEPPYFSTPWRYFPLRLFACILYTTIYPLKRFPLSLLCIFKWNFLFPFLLLPPMFSLHFSFPQEKVSALIPSHNGKRPIKIIAIILPKRERKKKFYNNATFKNYRLI